MTDSQHLSRVRRPGRYLGHEFNASYKDWGSARVKFALIFPDLYEIGMSHQGLQILYHILNRTDFALAERCYCPDIDLEKLLLADQRPLCSLESKRSLSNFDVLGFTLPYELCYTNILTVLATGGLPFLASERDNGYPLVIGGGACSLNPEPVADFFDAILLGDGEEAILEIAETVAEPSYHNLHREEQLARLATIPGIYIPQHFQPQYRSDGTFAGISRTGGTRESISRRIVPDLDRIDHLLHPLVPNGKIIHDRLGIEIARGCTRGCRFCQAGITYRPVRERSVASILELAEKGLANSGFEELALQSLSTGDFSCINDLLPQLMNMYVEQKVSVAMPSMRVGTLTPDLMAQIKRVRKTGFTLAPEAGSERLRQVINKGITEEDLLAACSNAFDLGWRLVKLYFMIGLPTESKTDHDELIQLIQKVMGTRTKSSGRGKRQINVSVGTFVPKPHTPFQWARQLSIAESRDILRDIGARLPRKSCNFRYHKPEMSFLEGVFSRGDRRLSRLIAKAWQQGARLDGWDEHFDLSRWQMAADELAIGLDSYLTERNATAPIPWEHLQSGVSMRFLREELDKAKAQIYTPDCRYHGCQECDLCDFKTIFPRVLERKQKLSYMPADGAAAPRQSRQDETEPHHRYIVHYSREGAISFLGHLEMLQLIFRTLHRAGLELNYSQGFNPSPKVSFGPALAAGTESLAEFFIMDLRVPIADLQEIIGRLNTNLVRGMKINAIETYQQKLPQKFATEYRLTLPRDLHDQDRALIAKFLANETFPIEKVRKNKSSQIDIKPLIGTITVCGPDALTLTLVTEAAQPAVKPIEGLKAILELDDEDTAGTSIRKLSWRALE